METVYVITGESGQYSDRSEWHVCATLSERRAEEIVSKLKELMIYNQEFRPRVQTFKDSYCSNKLHELGINQSYPVKPEMSHQMRVVHEMCAHGKGSKEDKNLFRNLQAEHIRNIDEWKKRYNEVSAAHVLFKDRLEIATQEWIEKNYFPKEHLLEVRHLCAGPGHYNCDTRYYYNKVNVL